jgi:hypothetical protein
MRCLRRDAELLPVRPARFKGAWFRLGLLDVAIAVCCTKVATTSDSRRLFTLGDNSEGTKFVGLERQATQWRCCNQGKAFERRSLKLPID